MTSPLTRERLQRELDGFLHTRATMTYPPPLRVALDSLIASTEARIAAPDAPYHDGGVKPLLKYPGAKWRMADWIIRHFPPHTHYVEPFFGSGAVFFNKPPAKHEVINDLSDDVVNLFRVIRTRGNELAAQIEMTPWARAEYELSYETCTDDLERARRFMVRVCQAYGSSLHAKTGWRNSGTGDLRVSLTANWQQFPARIVACVDRLRAAQIDSRPACEVIARHAAPHVLIYADPPYPLSTRAGAMYQHEMTDADHHALLDTLAAHPGPVVLSGYACALYDDRLTQWRRITKEVRADKGAARTEVLWLNSVCVERLGYGPMFANMEAA